MTKRNAIFCDIDGTIYDHNKKINSDAIKMVQTALSKNVDYIIATGNAFFDQVKLVGKTFNAEYAIVSNGAGIWDFQKQSFIFEKRISIDELSFLIGLANKYEVGAQWWDEDYAYYTKNVTPEVVEMLVHIMGATCKKYNGKISKPAFKFEIYHLVDSNLVEKIEREIQENGYEYARMQPHHIEVTASGVSKGMAAKWLCQNVLNLNIKDCMAIGDSPNDVSMLKEVDYSYVMENTKIDWIRKYAKFNAADVNQNGLGRAIEDYLFRIKA